MFCNALGCFRVIVYLLSVLPLIALAQSTCPEATSKPLDITYTAADLASWTPSEDGKIGSNIISASDGSLQFQLSPNAQHPEIVSPNTFLFKDLTASVTFRIDKDEDARVSFGWMAVGEGSLNPAFGLDLGSQTSQEPPEGASQRTLTAITNDFGVGNSHVHIDDYQDLSFGDTIARQPLSDFAPSGNWLEDQGIKVGKDGTGAAAYTITAVLGEDNVMVSGHTEDSEDEKLLSYGFQTAKPNLQLYIGAQSDASDEIGPYFSVISARISGCQVLSPEEIEAAKADVVAADALQDPPKATLEPVKQGVPMTEEEDADDMDDTESLSAKPSISPEASLSVQVDIPASPETTVFTSTGVTAIPQTVSNRVKTVTATTLVPITDDNGSVYSVEAGQTGCAARAMAGLAGLGLLSGAFIFNLA